MDYFPLFFDLKGRTCLLVGGGEIAFRKAELLRRAGPNIRVVAPRIENKLRELLTEGSHRFIERAYETSDLDGVALVIAATADGDVNKRVSREAGERQLPVNVVDQPDLCSVIFPAIVDRSPLVVAISTGGGSPVLTRAIREMLEGLIGEGYGRLGRYLANKRAELKKRFVDPDARRKHTERFMASPGAERAMQGDYAAADPYLDLDASKSSSAGEVYLVGAGPGDPDLLTLKALQLMQKADVVLYDSLVPDEILDRVRRDATRHYVGKQGGGESTSQESINQMLVRLARGGQRVLRLKGGDPFIFGRGGEELSTLVTEDIPFTVVPGVTAANGCAAYAGIPLTHRDYSQSVRFVTGHPKNGEVQLAWQEFAHQNQTIVFYMGLGGLKAITENLVKAGRDRMTPVAIISKGTTPDQQVVAGTLSNIVGLVQQQSIGRPTLLIVGEVVNLYEVLNPGAVINRS